MSEQPDIRPFRERGDAIYRLEQDFQYTVQDIEDIEPYSFYIKKGFTNDGASIPFPFDAFINRDGVGRAAFLIHDFICRNKGKMTQGRFFTRKEADLIMYKILKDFGMMSPTKQIILKSVQAYTFFTTRFGRKKW